VTPSTQLLTTPSGITLEYLVAGIGEPDPVTVFAHGRAGSIGTTRPFGSGIPGRKVFFHFRGHGRSTPVPPQDWTLPDLAGDLAAVADHVGATRALGVSLGAAALATLLAGTPDRFARVVFYLPAVVPVHDLSRVTAPALVLACRDDPVHPVEAASRLAAMLPDARLYVFERPAPVLTARAELRRRIAGFLAE
jgi:3-oxoadipate enol-lactonase